MRRLRKGLGIMLTVVMLATSVKVMSVKAEPGKSITGQNGEIVTEEVLVSEAEEFNAFASEEGEHFVAYPISVEVYENVDNIAAGIVEAKTDYKEYTLFAVDLELLDEYGYSIAHDPNEWYELKPIDGSKELLVISGDGRGYYCEVPSRIEQGMAYAKFSNNFAIVAIIQYEVKDDGDDDDDDDDSSAATSSVASKSIIVHAAPEQKIVLEVPAVDGYTYEWKKRVYDGTDYTWEIIENASDATYEIVASDRYSAYACFAYLQGDSKPSKVTNFSINADNGLKVQAADGKYGILAYPGQTVSLKVEVSAVDKDGLTYEWSSNGGYVNEDGVWQSFNGDWVIEAANGNECQIKALSAEEAFRAYICNCTVTDKYGNQTYTYFTIETVQDLIVQTSTTVSSETVDDACKDLKNQDNDRLIIQLQEDEAVEALDKIEETYKEAHDIVEEIPTSTVEEIPQDNIKVTGAALNVDSGTVGLKVDQTDAEPQIDEAQIKVKNVVPFDMHVVATQADGTNVDFSEELDIPVTVTLPIPESIDIDRVKLLHDQGDGTMEEVAIKIDKENRTATFTVTHFSLFAFVDEFLAQLGDINGDGEVNAKDRMYLARALAGWDGYTVPSVELADFNSDGEVNAKDRMYLARKLAGWDGYQ